MTTNIRSYGAVGDGVAEDANALINAINALSSAGGGTIYMPAGTYKISSDITWKSNVNLVGDGIGQTVIKLYGSARIVREGTLGNPLTDCSFTDLEVDGTNQTTFIAQRKGFFFTHCLRLDFTRVYVHDCAATGFGNDFMVDCSYTACKADRNGRLGTTADPGCSGFGIGAGAYATENTILTNCTAEDNKRYGVFFEIQGEPDDVTWYRSQGYQVVGGKFDGNQWGIGDCGVDSLIVDGTTITNNVAEGFYNGAPSLFNVSGINGTIINCEIANNGALGIRPANGGTGYILANNNVHDNGS